MKQHTFGNDNAYAEIELNGREFVIMREPFGWDYSGQYRIIEKGVLGGTTIIKYPNKPRKGKQEGWQKVKEWLKTQI